MNDSWTPGLLALHRYWTSTVNGKHNWPNDKRKWQEIERRYQAAEKAGNQKEMDQWVNVARRFADLCITGSSSWAGFKPSFLDD